MINPIDFSTRTREQRQEFETYKNSAFEPTAEEIAEREAQQKASKINFLTEKLALYGLAFVESDDYSTIFHEYIFGSPSMNEWIGNDERLQENYEYLVANKNTLDWLFNFVAQYE